MAIHYWKRFSETLGTRNFGDDLNPFLLGRLFSARIIASPHVCIMGIGSIINDRNVAAMDGFAHKIIFSSGAGYERLERPLDPSWSVACVRGPRTAALMGIEPSKAVCDGAILLSDFHDVVPAGRREGVAFVPHVHTARAMGRGLREICDTLGLDYVSPDRPHDDFVRAIGKAEWVLTEAMHGAILADTLRTPWLCCHILHHNRFKWQDWCGSLGLPYEAVHLGPCFSDGGLTSLTRLPQVAVSALRRRRIEGRLRRLLRRGRPRLSDEAVLEDRKRALRGIAEGINRDFAA